MFQHRSTEFEPRLSTIVGHLRAIEKELGGLGRNAGRRASARSSEAADHIGDAIAPILNEIANHLGRGQRAAVDGVTNLGHDAVRIGARVSNDALERIATRTKSRPVLALAVAVGFGILLGVATRQRVGTS